MIQNASCDPEGEKPTPRTPPVPTLNDLLGQGGVIFLPASCRSLLAEYTLFQVTRSATNGRIKSAIKCGGILEMDKDDACWARDADADAGVTACHL